MAVNETPIEAMQRMLDPSQPTDALHADLEEYLTKGPHGTYSVSHPLVYSIMHHERLNAFVNAQLEAKREALRRVTAKGEWSTYVWLHERPWRLWAFAQIARNLTDRRYWKLLGEIWTDSENAHECLADWHDALHSPRRDRWAIMGSKAERDRWRMLRKSRVPVLLYRGFCHDGGERGLSWTLSYSRGEWFAQRFADEEDPARLAMGICDGENIIAYFGSRGEDEVLVLPEHVHITRVREVSLYAQTKVAS